MLKANLVVGENQSVVLHAESVQELLKLAAIHQPQAPVQNHTSLHTFPNKELGVRLRIDLSHDARVFGGLLDDH